MCLWVSSAGSAKESSPPRERWGRIEKHPSCRRRGTSGSSRAGAIKFVSPLLHPSTRKPRVPGTPAPGLEVIFAAYPGLTPCRDPRRAWFLRVGVDSATFLTRLRRWPIWFTAIRIACSPTWSFCKNQRVKGERGQPGCHLYQSGLRLVAEAGDGYTTVPRGCRPILLDQRPQWIARSTNGARRSPQRYIVVRRKDNPWAHEQSLHRFAWHGRSEH